MEEMQEKLLRYRKQKDRQQKITFVKEKFKQFLMPFTNIQVEDSTEKVEKTDKNQLNNANIIDSDTLSTVSEGDELLMSSEDELETTTPQQVPDKLQYLLWFVYCLFWITLYIIAIELQFGIVYLMFSALLGIYFNTRTDKKKKNEISAYSVFNKNCQSIDGTLKAEQFEREIGCKVVV